MPVRIVAPMTTAGDRFGAAIALEQDYLAVGSDGVAGGAVDIFQRGAAGWEHVDRVTYPATDPEANFGVEVRLANGDLFVGAPGADPNGVPSAGLVRIFRMVGGTWTQVGELTADDGTATDWFGRYIEIEGDMLFVGAPRAENGAEMEAGAVYAYRRNGADWDFVQRIVAPMPGANDRFGDTIEIVDGSTVLFGVNPDDERGADSGAVHVYTRSSSTGLFEHATTLYAPDAAPGDRFGLRVSAGPGGLLVVTSFAADAPGAPDSGRAYVFERTGPTTWAHRRTLSPSMPASIGQFGEAMALSSGRLVIGGSRSDVPTATDSGSVHLYALESTLEVRCTDVGHIGPGQPAGSAALSSVGRVRGWTGPELDLLSCGGQGDLETASGELLMGSPITITCNLGPSGFVEGTSDDGDFTIPVLPLGMAFEVGCDFNSGRAPGESCDADDQCADPTDCHRGICCPISCGACEECVDPGAGSYMCRPLPTGDGCYDAGVLDLDGGLDAAAPGDAGSPDDAALDARMISGDAGVPESDAGLDAGLPNGADAGHDAATTSANDAGDHDSAVGGDAGIVSGDAGIVTADAGVGTDGGPPGDGGRAADVGPDASRSPGSSSGGCNCRVQTARGASAPTLGLAAMVGLALMLRRRRR